jgi:hypothetical protein
MCRAFSFELCSHHPSLIERDMSDIAIFLKDSISNLLYQALRVVSPGATLNN